MAPATGIPLPLNWRKTLGLARRSIPEFYENADSVLEVPHASAIRAALETIGLSAVYCVQGIPTVGILALNQYDHDSVFRIRAELWNQGIASLLLVIAEDKVHAYSLAMQPPAKPTKSFEKRCLLETFNLTTDALRIRELIDGAESGRLWNVYSNKFHPKQRVDRVLLDNLTTSHKLMINSGLTSDAAQALLIQTIFIAYLEDREIATPDYFKAVSQNRVESFSELLESMDARLVKALFGKLRRDFNGDLFVAPCSFVPQTRAPELTGEHLSILARFRSGKEEMTGGQLRFWGYDFRFIPIELVSAVYDRFLGERERARRNQGAYFTPMFLADLIVSQVWDALPDRMKSNGRFLDPACGSGVFLVRAFQRLCEHWRGTHKRRGIPWKTLRDLLGRVHGWDKDGGAVRVAVFSLYVALLEEVSPPDILELVRRGRLLPALWNNNLVCQDFFKVDSEKAKYEVIIGNPPWTSRGGKGRSSVRWCSKNDYPMPEYEDAWAFTWKAIEHLEEDGTIGYLLPAMGFLHNLSMVAVKARETLFSNGRVRRIINFADLRMQLFEQAKRPAAFMLFGRNKIVAKPYDFDYWCPKAGPSLRNKRVIALTSADKMTLDDEDVRKNPSVFKEQMRIRGAEAKLFAYLGRFSKLGSLVRNFRDANAVGQEAANQWVIGQGYKLSGVERPFRQGGAVVSAQEFIKRSEFVGSLLDLPIEAYTRLAQRTNGLRPANSAFVHRIGFERGFVGARILVPRGIDVEYGSRLRATYCTEPATFQSIILAISVPEGDEWRAKLLAALLNSRVSVWYAFHVAASFGSDRPEVKQRDLLRLPFPSPSDFSDENSAKAAADKLVAIIDDMIESEISPFGSSEMLSDALREIDNCAYAYFGLSKNEIAVIEDTVEYLIPGSQPAEGSAPELWRMPDPHERGRYAATLTGRLKGWLRNPAGIGARLMAHNSDLSILRISLDDDTVYGEEKDGELTSALDRLGRHLELPKNENLQSALDLRVFSEGYLYLIKPMQLRYWLRSAALSDADEIVQELQSLVGQPRLRSVG